VWLACSQYRAPILDALKAFRARLIGLIEEEAFGGLASLDLNPHRATIRDEAPPARYLRQLGSQEAKAEGSGPTRGGPLGPSALVLSRCPRILCTTGGSVKKERILIVSPHGQSRGSTS
jgi:hypothetical protein